MIKEVEQNDVVLNKFLHDNNLDIPINSPFARTAIYIEDELIIGYLNYSVMYEKAEINNIFVLNNFRGRGIATLLMEYLLEKCKSCQNITLEVRKDNHYALKLYKKFNFKEVALRKNYYNGIDGILMMREGE